MANKKIVKQWLTYAVRDMKLANHILAMGPEQKYAAGFHAQQCVEKAAKGLLVFHGVRVPKIHDIEALALLMVTVQPILGRKMKRLKSLTRFAVIYRYPESERKPVPFATIKSAVKRSKVFFDEVFKEVDIG